MLLNVCFVLLTVGMIDGFRSPTLHRPDAPITARLRRKHVACTNEDTMVPLDKARISRVCRNCKQQYTNDIANANEPGCHFHPGIYSGRLNRINDVDTSDLEYFWSCCGNYNLTSKGCIVGSKHVSYDDTTYTRYSVLTGKEIKY